MAKIAKQRGADIRIVGTRLQIANLLAAFSAKGFAWDSNEHFYPRIRQQGFFSYYLEDFELAITPPQNLTDGGFQSASATDQP